MTEEVKIQLPKLGESILGATVVQWLKKVGEHVELDEALLEVSTDKVNSEIPSPVAGILKEILVDVNEEVEVGAPLAVILAGDRVAKEAADEKKASTTSHEMHHDQSMHGFYSPAVLQMAMQENVSMQQLQEISGTGQGGRVTKKDLEHFIEKSKGKKSGCPLQSDHHHIHDDVPLISSPSTSSRVKMTGLRKAIADNMTKAYNEIPHAAIMCEVDVTELLKWIQLKKEQFFQEHGVKLTVTSYIAKAVALAVAKYPLANASVDGENIIVKHAVNVGIAVGVEHGVMVPVIKQCEHKDISAIAQAISDLSTRARSGQLIAQEVQEGTITITNFGMAGARQGFPIIRHPEVAIIGIGAIQKRLVVQSDDSIAIRQMADFTLCFDHRIMDGLYACAFLNTLKEELQNPDTFTSLSM